MISLFWLDVGTAKQNKTKQNNQSRVSLSSFPLRARIICLFSAFYYFHNKSQCPLQLCGCDSALSNQLTVATVAVSCGHDCHLQFFLLTSKKQSQWRSCQKIANGDHMTLNFMTICNLLSDHNLNCRNCCCKLEWSCMLCFMSTLLCG